MRKYWFDETLVRLAVLHTILFTICVQYSRADIVSEEWTSLNSACHLYFEYLAELNADLVEQYDDCDAACLSEKALWSSDLCRHVCEILQASGILLYCTSLIKKPQTRFTDVNINILQLIQ